MNPHIVNKMLGTDRFFGIYDNATFSFSAEIERLLRSKGIADTNNLGELHRLLDESAMTVGSGEINPVSEAFYKTDERFVCVYKNFIRQVIVPLFKCDLYFQQTPTIRFHFPMQRGFCGRPTFHTDPMLGHPVEEANIWLPVTDCFATNTMLLMGSEESEKIIGGALPADFFNLVQGESFWLDLRARSNPVEIRNGSFLIFNSKCLHATQHNTTDRTRVSIDFRVISVSAYHELGRPYIGTGRMKMPFAPGFYYEEKLLAYRS